MASTFNVRVEQAGASASRGTVRDHVALVDRPAAKEGTDQGPMGGEYLLLALGGCFMSNLLAAIKARAAAIGNVRVDVEGTIDGSPPAFRAIVLRVSADHGDRAEMEKLITISERACIVANTLRHAVALSVVLESP